MIAGRDGDGWHKEKSGGNAEGDVTVAVRGGSRGEAKEVMEVREALTRRNTDREPESRRK